MLKLANSFGIDTRIRALLSQCIALDEEDPRSGPYITRSNGRRPTGRPARYIVVYYPSKLCDCFFRLTAWSDDEAVQKANSKICSMKETPCVEAIVAHRFHA